MQSVFPFGHFCVDNNGFTMVSAELIVFSLGGEANYARWRSWNRVLNEIFQMFKIVLKINWEEIQLFVQFRDWNRTFANAFLPSMQISRCDVLRKEFANWPISLNPIVLVLHDLYLSCTWFEGDR